MYYIYMVTNLVNGRKYVGQTVNTRKRWGEHCRAENPDSLLSKAILKYGKTSFCFEVLGSCETVEEANKLELQYTQSLNSLAPNGYNLRAGDAEGLLSDQTKERMSQARKRHYQEPENREKARRAALLSNADPVRRKRNTEGQKRFWQSLSEQERKNRMAHMSGPEMIAKREETKRQRYEAAKAHQSTPAPKPTQTLKPKKVYQFISPSGQSVATDDLKSFCAENGLDRNGIYKLLNGKRVSSCGWTVPNPRQKKVGGNIKTFQLIDPDGQLVTITNLKKFCRENGLSYPSMRQVLRGGLRNYRGWRR